MKNYTIGTAMVIGGVVVIALGLLVGIPRNVSVGLGMAISTLGFVFQMHASLKMRAEFNREVANLDREMQTLQADHEAFVREIQDLPPNERDDRILEKIQELLPPR